MVGSERSKREDRDMSTCIWSIIEESDGVALVRCDDGRGSVVAIDRDRDQVYSALFSDQPQGGGVWCAPIRSAGIDYVTRPRSWSAARHAYRRLIRGIRDEHERS
jgi:hypothetical protein